MGAQFNKPPETLRISEQYGTVGYEGYLNYAERYEPLARSAISGSRTELYFADKSSSSRLISGLLEKLHPLSEILSSLSIIGALLRATLKALNTIVL